MGRKSPNPKPPHTVAFKMAGRTMVVLNDGETWTGLGGCQLVILPTTPEAEAAYTLVENPKHFVNKLKYDERSGVFNLADLIMDLPVTVLERYRVK